VSAMVAFRVLLAVSCLQVFTLAQVTQPAIETTEDNGLCLSAEGPIVLAKIDADGNKGKLMELATKDDVTTMVEAVETKAENVREDVTGLRASVDTLTGPADTFGSLNSVQDGTAKLVGDRFDSFSKTYLKKSDAADMYVTPTRFEAQFTELSKRLNDLQKIVDSSSKLPMCPKPTSPANGQVDHRYANAGGDHPDVPYVPGVMIHYSCENGYGIKGATYGDKDERAFERICYSDGTWASVTDKTKMVGDAECIKCSEPDAAKIDVSQYFGNEYLTGSASWGRDFRSGNPGQTNTWTIGPLDISGLKKVKFNFEYVVGYMGTCGYGKMVDACESEEITKGCYPPKWTKEGDPAWYCGQNRIPPQVEVFVANCEDTECDVSGKYTRKTTIYKTAPLVGYSYDRCGQNGGWGDSATKADGCYSPPVVVETSIGDSKWSMSEQSEGAPCKEKKNDPTAACARPQKTRTEEYEMIDNFLEESQQIKFIFEFQNNGQNMHLNPHHIDFEVTGIKSDPVNRACPK